MRREGLTMLRKMLIAGLLLGACLSPGIAGAQTAGSCVGGPNAGCPADVGNSRVQTAEPPRIGVSPESPGHDADAGRAGIAMGAAHGSSAAGHGGAGTGRGSGGGGHGGSSGGGAGGGGGGGHGK
jgi:hypothetical protein